MPTIQRYTRSQTIPAGSGNVKVDPNVAAAGGRAVAETANTAFDVVLEHKDRLRKLEEDSLFTNLRNDFNLESNTILINERQKTRQDAVDGVARYDEWTKTKIKELTKDITNPELLNRVNESLTRSSYYTRTDIASHQANEMRLIREDDRNNAVRVSIEQAATGNLYQALDSYNETLNTQVASGAISEGVAKEEKLVAVEKIATAHLESVMADSPHEAANMIESGYYAELIPGDKLKKYAEMADNRIKAKERDAEAKAQKAEALAKEIRTQAVRESNTRLTDFMIAGELTEEAILKELEKYPRDDDGQDKAHWYNALEAQKKESKKLAADGYKRPNNENMEAQLQYEIATNIERIKNDERYKDQIEKKLREALVMDGGIDAGAFRRLSDEVDPKDKDPLKDGAKKVAYKRLNDLYAARAIDTDEWTEKTLLLQKYINNHYNSDNFDPVEYETELEEEAKDGALNALVGNLFSSIGPYETEEERKKRLEAKAEGVTSITPEETESNEAIEGTTYSAPTWWLEDAKKMNPESTEEELIKYYSNKYGNPE